MTALILVLAASVSPAMAQGLPDGLLHHWSGEDAGIDEVGGADAILGATTAFAPGINGQAFDFDGEYASIVRLPVDINAAEKPQLTMGMWINLDRRDNNYGWVIGHDNGGYDRSINVQDSRYGYGVAGGTGRGPHRSTLLSPTANLGEWLCVAVAYDADAATATFYADGETQTVVATPGRGVTETTLGGLTNYRNHEVDGLVDEVFMFDRVLSAEELDDACAFFANPDSDDDGVPDSDDLCPGTVADDFPDFGVNRWGYFGEGIDFETEAPAGRGPGGSYTTEDTLGCSCTQILESCDLLGTAHVRMGCTKGTMDSWVDDPATCE